MVAVYRFTAPVVGYRQPPAGPEPVGERGYQPPRLREVRQRVEHDHAVKSAPAYLLGVRAYELYAAVFDLFAGNAYHLRREVHPRDALRAELEVIREEHSCAAGHVEDLCPRAHARQAEDVKYLCAVGAALGVPAPGQAVEEAAHLLAAHGHAPTSFLF